MKKFGNIWIAAFFCLGMNALLAQPLKEYEFVSLMTGETTLYTDSNTLITLPIWGFGWDQANPFITLPGPTVYAKEGDSVHVNMFNPSMEGHTIHLHGLDVDMANDGAPHHTGNVLTDESFKYRFKATHAGNFLYHCHVTTTMHLTLGMYGMVIIYPADSSNTIYTNGPSYDKQHEYLLSEMDSRWNKDYTAIGSFLSYAPDLFLLNGKNRQFVYEDTNMVIAGNLGEQHLLRFLNVGYKVNRVIFPAELNAVVHTSDGRVLSSPFQADTLIVYPGERFSVLAEIMDTAPSFVRVDYLDPYRLKYLDSEYIPVNDENFAFFNPNLTDDFTDTIGVGMKSEQPTFLCKVFPVPAQDKLWISSWQAQPTAAVIFDLMGGKVSETVLSEGIDQVDLSGLADGFYLIQVRLESGDVHSQRIVVKR